MSEQIGNELKQVQQELATDQSLTLRKEDMRERVRASIDPRETLFQDKERNTIVSGVKQGRQTDIVVETNSSVKNEPARFMGDGVSFKAKLIGILEVSEARGDRMCQAALADLKMAIRAAGEHKQRITVHINIDGLRLRDEKNGDCLYHHPVHKISFIAQDMSDSRAFGYIFGSPDTGHRFFGIKTDKAASQVVIAMRDLFQVVFELKKKEIEVAKQHIEHNVLRGATFSMERSSDTKGVPGNDSSLHRTGSDIDRSRKQSGGAVADLLDLQCELRSLQQGIKQMDQMTPDGNKAIEDPFESDPFGDSFANMKIKEQIKPILPPPPSSSKRSHYERQSNIQKTPSSGTSSPANIVNNKTPPPQNSSQWFDKGTEELFNDRETSNSVRKNSSSDEDRDMNVTSSQDGYKQLDIFSELDPLGTGKKKPYVDKKDFFQNLKNPPKRVLKELATVTIDETFQANFLKTSDTVRRGHISNSDDPTNKFDDSEIADLDRMQEKHKEAILKEESISPKPRRESHKRSIQYQSLSVSLPPEESSNLKSTTYPYIMSNSMTTNRFDNRDSNENIQSIMKLPSPKKYSYSSRKAELISDYPGFKSQSLEKSFPVDFSSTSDSPASPLRSCSSGANSRLSSSSAELENVPEPPPRGAGSVLINPPPLPPKKHSSRGGIKPPPRPPYGDGHFHYDFLEREEGSPSPRRRRRGTDSPKQIMRDRFDDDFSPPLPQLPKKSDVASDFSDSGFDCSFSSSQSTTNNKISSEDKKEIIWASLSKDITLSQLTPTYLTDLADNLGVSVSEITSLTIKQLAGCIDSLVQKERAAMKEKSNPEMTTTSPVTAENDEIFSGPESQQAKVIDRVSSQVANEPLFEAKFDQDLKPVDNLSSYDKYAVLRELIEMEQANGNLISEKPDEEGETIASENQEESIDIEDDVQSDGIEDTIESLSHIALKVPSDSEEQTVEVSTYYEMKSSNEQIESPKEPTEDETEAEEQYYSMENSKREELHPEQTPSNTAEPVREDSEISTALSDNFVMTAEEVNELSRMVDKKPDVKNSTSTSSDRYAALREIISETEGLREENNVISTNNDLLSSVAADLQDLFTDDPSHGPSPLTTKPEEPKIDNAKSNVMDIFEEIKLLNSDAHAVKESKVPNADLENVFDAFSGNENEKTAPKDDESWVKFEFTTFPPERPMVEGQSYFEGTSPWSPEDRVEFVREPNIKRPSLRHNSGGSDNEWRDDDGSEGSNGKVRGEPPCCAVWHPRYDVPPCDSRSCFDGPEEDQVFREKVCRKTRGAPWMMGPGYRARDSSPWHDDSRHEEEQRRRHPHRKFPHKDEEELKAYWKCRSKQQPPPRAWNGDREGYWGPDYPHVYEDECGKRRMASWSEEGRFSSQESMGYEDEERWFRREYETGSRRRYPDEDGVYWRPRGPAESDYYKKVPRHYDYPPSWEEEYAPPPPPKHPEEIGISPSRYHQPPSSRKKHWPKRPNSANDGRDMIYSKRSGAVVSRSECSDNDSDPHNMHRPAYRSRSRESYWSSDQEFDNWAERPYWSEGPDAKTSERKQRMSHRHRVRLPPPKSQNSPFEDDFTQGLERGDEVAEPNRVDLPKQPSSPRSPRVREHPRRAHHKSSSSYLDDDLTPTASASSDTSDRPRLSSDLKTTPEDSPRDPKEPGPIENSSVSNLARDAYFNGDSQFDDDAFTFQSELEDQVPEPTGSIAMKNSGRNRYSGARGARSEQYLKKSESVNIFSRENDPFDDDEFFK
ncbi:hypothetical protein QAD02_005870 [Eretmocerus hayati]|uniref:Uncharacterized protein n=1 Tax=Eretmocerus hayati TaxID=131215 RepID=A0ACC2NUR6_9HYME|nr:hypothetical protein QAD02_005870 [Eretmocerus hayati]